MGECCSHARGPGTKVRLARDLACAVLAVWFVTLIAAGSAEAGRGKAVPSVTYECTPAPADCSGWYRSDVSIDWTVLPSDAETTGCQDATYTADTPGTNEFCRADDRSAVVTVQLRIRVDQTPPVVTGGTPGRPADAGGWYNHAVSVAFAGSDLTSGVDSCTATTYGGPDSGAASIAGTCTDKAGNTSAALGYGLKYDETAPAVTEARPERAPNSAGWFNRAVGFDVAGADATSGIADCPPVGYDGPDSATASIRATCRDRAGNAAGRTFALRYDETAPVATGGQAGRPPDVGGWYNRSVAVAFRGTDGLSGVDACATRTYDGPDGGAASVPGTCRDVAGNTSAPFPFALKYDATGPEVTGANPERPADHAGWYAGPVRFDFTGSDPVSGLDGCLPATYSGPDGAGGLVQGRCRDRAGNSTVRGFSLDYDATAPPLTDLTANGGVGTIAVGWRTSEDARTVEVHRTPGLGSEPRSSVFGGPGSSFFDNRVTGGVQYTYEVRVTDAAGHATAASVQAATAAAPATPPDAAAPLATAPLTTAPPTRPRISPPPGAILRAGKPPLLQWPAVPRARYYNVQLFRGGRKILTAWPKVARYQLKRHWTFRDERMRLSPGRYHWLVWPGYGKRSAADYGERVVKAAFVVRRRTA